MEKEEKNIPVVDVTQERKRLKEEKKKLRKENKEQKKAAKARAKEISKQEASLSDEDSEGGTVSAIAVTVFIVLIWLAILCLLIKLDVGGFGSRVLRPVLKDVPVLNWILPKDDTTETNDEEAYGGYTSLRDAVDQIKELERQIEQLQIVSNADEEELEQLRAENARLQTFEQNQLNFEKIKNEFYEEVIYAENGPGVDAYIKYYESMDPTTAQTLYAQAIADQQVDEQLEDYVRAYSEMKPKEAAAIFESMTDDLELVAKILSHMSAENRGSIMGVMDPAIAARLTKLMDPTAQ